MNRLAAAALLLVVFTSALLVGCSASQKPLTERQKARRFLPIVKDFVYNHALAIQDKLRARVYRDAHACGVKLPEGNDLDLAEVIGVFLMDSRLAKPYARMHAKLSALHPHAAPLRILVSSSGVQMVEALKFAVLKDPDVCDVTRSWRDAGWKRAFLTSYAVRVMNRLGVNWRLMRRERRRAEGTFTFTGGGLSKLGLHDQEALDLSTGVSFPIFFY